MTDVTYIIIIIYRLTPSHRRRRTRWAREGWRGEPVNDGGRHARLGAAAELVAPLGCVTGSARYLFLIRPDGDDYDYGGGGGGDVWPGEV